MVTLTEQILMHKEESVNLRAISKVKSPKHVDWIEGDRKKKALRKLQVSGLCDWLFAETGNSEGIQSLEGKITSVVVDTY